MSRLLTPVNLGSIRQMLIARAFNHPLALWDVSNVIDMSFLFAGAVSFDQTLDNTYGPQRWAFVAGQYYHRTQRTVAKQQQQERLSCRLPSYLLRKISDLAFGPYEGGWDVGNVRTMHGMFARASSFNSPLSRWNVRSVVDVENMYLSRSRLQVWVAPPTSFEKLVEAEAEAAACVDDQIQNIIAMERQKGQIVVSVAEEKVADVAPLVSQSIVKAKPNFCDKHPDIQTKNVGAYCCGLLGGIFVECRKCKGPNEQDYNRLCNAAGKLNRNFQWYSDLPLLQELIEYWGPCIIALEKSSQYEVSFL
jgi:hypothetical protein